VKSANHGVYSGSSPHGTTKYSTTIGLRVATTEQERRRSIVKPGRDEDSASVGRRTSLYKHDHARRRNTCCSSGSDFHTTYDRDQHF
jgi:hypothetical protein